MVYIQTYILGDTMQDITRAVRSYWTEHPTALGARSVKISIDIFKMQALCLI